MADSCDDLDDQTATIPSTINELAQLVGTDKDPSGIVAALGDFAPQLAPRVSACAPELTDAMWQFLTDVEELRQKYTTNQGQTEMAETKLRLLTVRAGGMALFDQLGLGTDSWASLPVNAQPACSDAASVGALMTWDVRHLANLIGSDNTTDAAGYAVEMTALTSALADLVDECRPKARAAMGDFEDAMSNLVTTYQPGADETVVAQDKEAMGRLRAAGIALFARMGLDETGWKVIPTTEQ